MSTDVPIIAIGMIDSVLSVLSCLFFGDVDNSDYSISIIIIPVLLIIVIISICYIYTYIHFVIIVGEIWPWPGYFETLL